MTRLHTMFKDQRVVGGVIFAFSLIGFLANGHATFFPPPPPKVVANVKPTQELNPYIERVMAEYPTDGTYKYIPPTDPKFVSFGVTRDIYYRGTRIAEGDPQQRSHCVGLVFEVFMRAWQRVQQERGTQLTIGSGKLEDFKPFYKRFYGADGNMGAYVDALQEYGLGVEIKDLDQAKKGDFIQIYRFSGSGHSGIFDSWVRDASGNRTAVRYLQSGFNTDGVAYLTDSLRVEDLKVRRNGLCLVRAIIP